MASSRCMGKYYTYYNTHFGWCLWNVIIYNFEFCFWPNKIVNHTFECFKPTFAVMVIGVCVTINQWSLWQMLLPCFVMADVIAISLFIGYCCCQLCYGWCYCHYVLYWLMLLPIILWLMLLPLCLLIGWCYCQLYYVGYSTTFKLYLWQML